MVQAIDAFISDLKNLQSASPNTVRAYRQQIDSFHEFIRSKHLEFASVRRETLIEWMESMVSKRLMPRSRALAVSSVRKFYGWMLETGRIAANPVPSSMGVKVKDQEVTSMTAAEFLAIRRSMVEKQPLKIVAALELMAGSGLRVGAIVTIRQAHLNLEGQRPHVMVDDGMACKGKRAGEVPLTPFAAAAMRRYLATLPDGYKGPLFDVSEQTVRDWCDKASSGLYPHALRHFYCAMMYYRNLDGGRNDAVWVRDAAGHSSIAITDKYLKAARRVCQSDTEWDLYATGGGVVTEKTIICASNGLADMSGRPKLINRMKLMENAESGLLPETNDLPLTKVADY